MERAVTAIAYLASIVLLVAVAAAWDIARKYVAAKKFNEAMLDRMSGIDRELEKQHEQQQAILGKLHATIAATNMRSMRAGAAR